MSIVRPARLFIVIVVCFLGNVNKARPYAAPSGDATTHYVGVAISHDTVYRADSTSDQILIREPGDNEFKLFLADPRIHAPRGLAVDDQYLYIADPVAHGIFRVNLQTREIDSLVINNSHLTPIDVSTIPALVRTDKTFTKTAKLLILDTSKPSVFTTSFSTPGIETILGKHVFKDPRSISTFADQIFVPDYAAGTIYAWNGTSDWVDLEGISFSFSAFGGLISASGSLHAERTGYFFPTLTHPETILAYRDFLYVIDSGAVYSFLVDKRRLIPVAYPLTHHFTPSRVLVNQSEDKLLIFGSTPADYATTPLPVPMTVEVDTRGDISTPLATLYSFLWQAGYLPVATITMPYRGPTGVICTQPKCVIEKGRGLVPHMTHDVEELVCKMNAPLCLNGHLGNVQDGSKLTVPDVPLEPFLADQPYLFDGKTSVRQALDRNVRVKSLLSSIEEIDLKERNPSEGVSFDSFPPSGTRLVLPVQRSRFYLSIPRTELYSQTSRLAEIVKAYRSLSIRPYGMSAQPSSATGVSAADIPIVAANKIQAAEKTLLQNIGYDATHTVTYGRGIGVPILISEPLLDCKHPVFFGSTLADRAFLDPGCRAAEQVSQNLIVDWSESTPRHGTCVASIIGGRAGVYFTSLAPGSSLSKILTQGIDAPTLKQFYWKLARQAFVVNISSGDTAVTAENTWQNLLSDPLIQQAALFVAAADNDAKLLSKVRKFPAILARGKPNLISVGALDSTGANVWQNGNQGSNTGSDVELLAPGDAVPCAIEVSQDQALYSIPPGTSFATPIVSAVAALLLEKRLSPGEVKARLLATADPLQAQLNGQPLAQFGRLNIDHALMDPSVSYLEFKQGNTQTSMQAYLVDGSVLTRDDPAGIIIQPTPMVLTDLLSVRQISTDSGGPIYRIVTFDPARKSIELVDNVHLNGCLEYQGRDDGRSYIFKFGGGCTDAATPPDNAVVVSGLDLFVAPTLGAVRFR